jgi:hypothetical protein
MVEQSTKSQKQQDFANLAQILKEFAQVSGGKFETFPGIDPREIEAMGSPFSDSLPAIFGRHSDDASTKKMLDEQFSNAVVDWQYRRFQVRMQVRNIYATGTNVQAGSNSFDLSIRCNVQPRSPLRLLLYFRKSSEPRWLDWLEPHPTGWNGKLNLPSYLKPFTPRGASKWLEDAPDTYYCPFDNVELDKNITVRSSSVALGRAFVGHPDIVSALVKSCSLNAFLVGHDVLFGGQDIVVRLDAVAPQNLDQLQALLTIVLRTLDLLDQFKLID